MITKKIADTAYFLVDNNGISLRNLDEEARRDVFTLYNYGYLNIVDDKVSITQKLLESIDEIIMLREVGWLDVHC